MQKLVVGFTGDFCPWRRMEQAYLNNTWREKVDGIRSFFLENDLNILDLECPLTTSTVQIEKTGPHIKAHPGTAAMLNYLNCELVATANNHFKDYGWEGMEETYKTLREHQIEWFGSGANLEEASQTFYWQKEGITIAFINVAENEWTTTFGSEPGCHPLDTVSVFNQIQSAKQKSDFIVVVAHGGHEHYNLPSPRMKKLYRFFVDAGANAVVSHHTHIISGYEVYNQAPIFYSLGNFCFDWEGMTELPWNLGMIIKLKFEKGKAVEFECDYVSQNSKEAGLRLLGFKEKEELKLKQNVLNGIISDDVKLEKAFEDYIQKWKPVMNTWIQPYTGKYLPSLYKKGILPPIISEKKKLLFTNLMRCESHRDILINSINPTK